MAQEVQFLSPNQQPGANPTPREVVEQKKSVSQQVFPNVQHWFNEQGFLKTVTTTPLAAPKTLADGLVIYVDSLGSPTTKRLYMYSPDASAWFYVALT